MTAAWPAMTIPRLVDHVLGSVAKAVPGQPALHLEDKTTWTYAEAIDESMRWAAGFQSLGITKGDRVAVLSRNSLEYWAAYLAATRLGAIVVRLNFRLTADELEYALSDSGSSVLVAEDDLLQRVEPVLGRTDVRATVNIDRNLLMPQKETWSKVCAGHGFEPVDVTPDDVAMVMYTSGTTGRPKGAVWTHAMTTAFALMQAAEYGFGPSTVGFVTGPMYHVGALETLANPALMLGGQVVIMQSGAFDLRRALEIMERRRVTDAILFPFMIYDLLRGGLAENYDLSRLRKVITGGDPLLPWAAEAFAEGLPHTTLIQNYGSTEGSPVATCARISPQDPLGTVGRPMPMTTISIRDEAGVPVHADGVGEIWVRGPAVSAGYWGKPAETHATFVDGWCRTGDLGQISATGQLVISGRMKDMIKTGGENVYGAEVEDVLARHPAIIESAVIGLPDQQFTEAVTAVVVVAPGQQVDADEVIAWCKSHIASYKKPRHVFFVDELPRNASGKIMKYKLRERFGPVVVDGAE